MSDESEARIPKLRREVLPPGSRGAPGSLWWLFFAFALFWVLGRLVLLAWMTHDARADSACERSAIEQHVEPLPGDADPHPWP